MTQLAGQSALITGGARGIGLAFAKAHLAEGAQVAIGDIDVGRAEAAEYIVAQTDNVDGGNWMS
ncbi:SDR family NAD(P)-dependent oxidoreductase [uncultured Roseobacter sp.]|uniref:SDR family NAD(P)-dependent oxidoreductase n=1 Tax=uncultured Roseobacter sp. TaxID=114847 RepID=UPI00345DF1C2